MHSRIFSYGGLIMAKGLERRLEHYSNLRTMNAHRAVGIAEGFIESSGEAETLEAWQFLVDSGLAWQLQGFFGRTATVLIERGLITAPARSSN
jgi:hypothetical protein